MTGWKRGVAAMVLLGTAACGDVSCWWTDHPNDHWTVQQPNRQYRSDDGRFDVVLRPEGAWPPVVGTTSLVVEWQPVTSQADATPALTVERPHLFDGDLTAEQVPAVKAIEPMRWRIEALEFDAPGRWVVPLVLEGAEEDDSLDLHIEVEEAD